MATEGTVTVLVMADQILSKEEGHVSEYAGYYMHAPKYGYYDSGLTCGLLERLPPPWATTPITLAPSTGNTRPRIWRAVSPVHEPLCEG